METGTVAVATAVAAVFKIYEQCILQQCKMMNGNYLADLKENVGARM